eukprot:gene11069-14858_t
MPDTSLIVLNSFVIILCLVSAALAAGLTQGLLSINALEMAIKTRSGSQEEIANASKILPIISNHHLLLVTLLLFNAIATETLPLFLDPLLPKIVTIILSVTLILLFGEIIPSAIFTGPMQLNLAARMTPFVWCLIAIMFPISYPVSLLLDYLLGHDDGMTVYNKSELRSMMKIQYEEANKRGRSSSDVHEEEISIMDGVLRYREMKVEEVMTKDVFMLSITEKLDFETMSKIFNAGFSRIPIYEKNKDNILGYILSKDLIFIDPEDELPMKKFFDLFGRPTTYFWPDSKLGEVLRTLRKTHSHMGIVRDANTDTE